MTTVDDVVPFTLGKLKLKAVIKSVAVSKVKTTIFSVFVLNNFLSPIKLDP
jgi:hypothetical protein